MIVAILALWPDSEETISEEINTTSTFENTTVEAPISNEVINNEASSYCEAVQSLDLSNCVNFEYADSLQNYSMREECIKNILLKKMVYEKKDFCNEISDSENLAVEECEDIFSKIMDPSLVSNPELKLTFEAFNKNDLSMCDGTSDPNFCKFILDKNYNCAESFFN